MLTPYHGTAHDDLSRFTGARHTRYGKRAWFVELWLRGRYLGIAR